MTLSTNTKTKTKTKFQRGGYEVTKLCSGSAMDSNGWYLVVLSHYDEAFIDVLGQ